VRTSGQITVDGVDVTKLSTHQVARLGVAHVPEGRGTLRELTVQENLLMGAYGRGRREKRTKLAEVLDLLPQLRDRRKQQAGTLSGGEQQILSFGRTLMADPKLLLLDEPSLGLSPKATSDVYRIITDTVRANKLTVLLAEQNVAYASRIADRAYVMQTGYTREVSDLQALPELADTYLS
jgi:branched-chain amino acid transport system ATP-binding protein